MYYAAGLSNCAAITSKVWPRWVAGGRWIVLVVVGVRGVGTWVGWGSLAWT